MTEYYRTESDNCWFDFALVNICILSHVTQSYGARQNLTLRNFVLPGPIIMKLGVIDYVGNPCSYPVLVELS